VLSVVQSVRAEASNTGVPVSIKDHILLKGQDTASGYLGWAFKTYADRDAVVVDVLRRAGAIIFVKTANPQTLMVSLL
jgi:amidase